MTPNFKKAELECKCGCGMLPDQDFMDLVQQLRERVGIPLSVTSAARCPSHNSKVSGTGLNGPHTTGRAIDLGVRGQDAWKVLKVAMDVGVFSGIGVSQKGSARFIHLDDLLTNEGRLRPTVWSY